jgi:PadR family transcriptional regulator PadR
MVVGETRDPTRDPLTELRRGVLEHCVLAVMRRKEAYAFEIVRVLSDEGGLVTSEGTIYPLLSRLRRDGLVQTTWRESETGPPRRYYRLTTDGEQALDTFTTEWTRFRDAVDAVLVAGPDGRISGGH